VRSDDPKYYEMFIK